MNQTEKNDWLNDFLAPKNFVSSHESFRVALGLPEESFPSIRYINLSGKYLWLLTIEASEENWETIKNNLDKNQAYNLINSRFEEYLNVLLYSPEKMSCFSYKSYNSNYEDTDGNGLREKLKEELKSIDVNIGTSKEENKSLNDNFQKWTRENLSMYCVINDFDAVFLTNKEGEKCIIYELKRVGEDIVTWEPYTDETRNYQRVNDISSKLGFNNFTIAYNVKSTETFAVHYNIKPQVNQITGTRIIYDVKNNQYIKTSKKSYVSKRKRQKRI
ncbi:hypothetical protein ACQKL6_06305 [Peribacillus sp. NPDC097197]|uniref:hypothetical protein n=1 Tax=Peribacillus sp. NPDC097197 TaxID=3390615 RepID=UPI003D061C1D